MYSSKLLHNNYVNILFDLINEFGEAEGNDELLPENFHHYVNIADSFLTTFKDVIEKLESDKFGPISYVLPGLVMLKASAEQFRESYPELFATFEGSNILHVDIILSVPEKKEIYYLHHFSILEYIIQHFSLKMK